MTYKAGGNESDRQSYYGDTLQPWDLIKALGMGADFCAGNVIKYVGRYRGKDGLQDLKKALWYLNRLIELKEKEASDVVLRKGDSGLLGSVRKAADNNGDPLSAVHSQRDPDSPGPGAELGQQPGNPVAEDDVGDYGDACYPHSLGL